MDMGEAGRRLALTLAVGLAPAVAIAAEPEVLARIGRELGSECGFEMSVCRGGTVGGRTRLRGRS